MNYQSNAAIEIRHLTKKFSEVTAVDSLSLTVQPGEIYGFLGRNGAGKTTTIRMLLGLVRPSGGSVRIFGQDVISSRSAAVSKVGSLVETATAYPNLTVLENLEIQRKLSGAPAGRIGRVISLLGLEEYSGRRAGRLSLGNKQRLALARAILPGPRLLVLDEPANALDPAGIVEIRNLLRRLADTEHVTMFISSHILGEVAQLVDRIGIIHRGRLVDELDAGAADETPEKLILRVSDPSGACRLLKKECAAAAVNVGADGNVEIFTRDIQPPDAARAIVMGGVDLISMYPVREDLESRFLRLTGGDV